MVETATTPKKIPKKIGEYLLEYEIGRGAHGIVYRAHSRTKPDVSVALKVVENRGNLDKLMVEPELLSKVRQPNIVQLEDYFLHHDQLIVVLEFIEGEELTGYLKRHGSLSSTEVRDFLRQMASALQAAHEKGILHRDMKLSNILVTEVDGKSRFVLTDFGISHLTEGIQVTKRIAGTYRFMAPEQLRGRPSPQSDLWSLGVVAYALCTGKLPFNGQTLGKLSKQVFYETPQLIDELNSEFNDEELEQIIYNLLEKQMDNRTDSAGSLLTQLGESPTKSLTTAEPTSNLESFESKTRPRTYDRQLQRKIRFSWLFFFVSAVFMSGPLGFASAMCNLSGAWFLYLGHQASKRLVGYLWVAGAFLMMLLAWIVQGIFAFPLLVLLPVQFLFTLIFPYLTIYFFTKARKLQREQVLRNTIASSSTDDQQYLATLKAFHNDRQEDAQFHLKYAEALLARGHTRDAIVEAQLILRTDPYHWGANLLLAHGYFEVHLWENAMNVCDSYLEASGYCFEFADLKEHCSKRLGVAK